ncbi:cytochrome P450 [Annulohypoxylon stygium]|nr:cytochrome P450 [Annulohypoxylon stygium]
MEALSNLFSWPRLGMIAVLYFATLAFYRLFLHPLSRFPGPKLAAISRWYEAYYDVIQNGQYTFKIAELHKIYDGVWDKYDWSVDAFATQGAALLTPKHELHKARRQPLNPFFSKANVRNRQDMIDRHLGKLCDRIFAFAVSRETFNFGAAITAFARDVAFDFILGKNYGSLDKDDFDEAMENMEDTKRLVASARSPSPNENVTRNIVHEIIDSKLPAPEKTAGRIFDDVATITGAGFETVAGALRVALFHAFDNKDILQQLRAELATIDTHNLKALEQLPYLKAILMEGLRISPALGTRMARIAPDRDLFYEQWRIPAGTPVGMTLVLLHANESLYPDPRRFNPNRWMDPSGAQELDKTFAPFLRGTRSCLGMYLAWAEMYLLVANLVDRFDFGYLNARAKDFECDSDQFAIGTRGKGVLEATVSLRDGGGCG